MSLTIVGMKIGTVIIDLYRIPRSSRVSLDSKFSELSNWLKKVASHALTNQRNVALFWRCFPALDRLRFPALGTANIISRARHPLHVFPRLTWVSCFPALDTGYLFSRARHRLQVLTSDSHWFAASFTFTVIGQTWLLLSFALTEITRRPLERWNVPSQIVFLNLQICSWTLFHSWWREPLLLRDLAEAGYA